MLDWHRSNSAEFPRQKIYLTSLSQLMERKLVLQPEIEVNNKLFPQRSFAKKLSVTHQRLKNNLQLRSRKFDLNLNSKKVKDLVVENQRAPTCEPTGRIQRQKSFDFRSTHFQPTTQLHFSERFSVQPSYSSTLPEKMTSPQPQTFEERPESSQKTFLRKGSSLQKQIVVNLLRSKLLRERELNEKKQYSNHEIIKMIQVFKGVACSEIKSKKALLLEQKEKSREKKKKGSEQKDIKGWQHQAVQDYQQTQHEQK